VYARPGVETTTWRFALKRSAQLYAALLGAIAVAGAIWAYVDHHAYAESIAFLLYIGATFLAAGATFAQSRPRKVYEQLTVEERRKAFTTHMWMLGIAAALAATGIVLQVAF
jgi:peptidoglycan/LPS O-acetylase OafA/YrhL